MKVLLVYPEFPDTYRSFKHALRFEDKRSAFPPLGLLTVTAMLPADREKRLVDLNVEPLAETEQTLPEFPRDFERGIPPKIYRAAEKPALTSPPVPDFKSADLDAYRRSERFIKPWKIDLADEDFSEKQ